MKNLAAPALVAIALMFPALSVLAEVDEPTAYRLMQETFLWDSMTAIPDDYLGVAQSAVIARTLAETPASAQRVFQAANAAFNMEFARDSALYVLRTGLDADTVEGVRKWNATPLGQKLLVTDRTSAAGILVLYRGFDGVAVPELDDARRRALTDIIAARKIADTVLEVGVGQSLIVARSLAVIDPTRRDLPSAEQLAKRDMSEVRQQLPILLLPVFVKIYADYTTEELRQYALYLRSPAGSKLAELHHAAVRAVVNDANEEFHRRLSRPVRAGSG